MLHDTRLQFGWKLRGSPVEDASRTRVVSAGRAGGGGVRAQTKQATAAPRGRGGIAS